MRRNLSNMKIYYITHEYHKINEKSVLICGFCVCFLFGLVICTCEAIRLHVFM